MVYTKQGDRYMLIITHFMSHWEKKMLRHFSATQWVCIFFFYIYASVSLALKLTSFVSTSVINVRSTERTYTQEIM